MSGNRTPDLSTIFRKAIAAAAAGLRVMQPAKVISYDKDKQVATVLPLFQETSSTTEDAKELPQLIECPVWHLRVGLAAIYLPIRPGDKVALLFADKSLDNWQASDGENPLDPQDTRTHDLTDALVIPGMYSPNDPIPNVDPADIRIVLYDTSGAIRSQFYLGGDTGDIVLLPENRNQFGATNPTNGAARNNDAVKSTPTEESVYWSWLIGMINVLQTWVVAPNDGGLALQTAMKAYILANAVPQELTGKIIEASDINFVE